MKVGKAEASVLVKAVEVKKDKSSKNKVVIKPRIKNPNNTFNPSQLSEQTLHPCACL